MNDVVCRVFGVVLLVDVVCFLMKSATLPPTDPSSPDLVTGCLTARDLQAFTSRMFLETALNISHPNSIESHSTYSVNFIDALKNVCNQFPTNDVIKVIATRCEPRLSVCLGYVVVTNCELFIICYSFLDSFWTRCLII